MTRAVSGQVARRCCGRRTLTTGTPVQEGGTVAEESTATPCVSVRAGACGLWGNSCGGHTDLGTPGRLPAQPVAHHANLLGRLARPVKRSIWVTHMRKDTMCLIAPMWLAHRSRRQKVSLQEGAQGSPRRGRPLSSLVLDSQIFSTRAMTLTEVRLTRHQRPRRLVALADTILCFSIQHRDSVNARCALAQCQWGIETTL